MKYNLRRNPEFRGPRYISANKGPRPVSVDFRHKLPPAFDQGEEGSCGPNSASGFMCYYHPNIPAFSRQQIYYDVRKIEGDLSQDAGVQTDDLFKVLQDTGAACESLWPYSPKDLYTAPPESVVEDAAKHRIKAYHQLASEEDFLDCLAEGSPFILGFNVYETFQSDQMAKTGIMVLPQSGQVLGGHDVLICGYDTDFLNSVDFLNSGISEDQVSDTMLLVRNSWGVDWGIHGYFWMPIEYAANANTGGDCWTGRV